MIIPCIDVMGGKVVQLVHGEKKALELDSPDEALQLFEGFPLLHVIDLDAALGRGENRELVAYLLSKVSARVGGGVRSVERAQALVELGASQVIAGTSAFGPDGVNVQFLSELVSAIGRERIIVAIDVKGGKLAIRGWQSTLETSPFDVVTELSSYCAGFLCTYVDREGMMEGTDLPFFLSLRKRVQGELIAAGGISSMSEVVALVGAGIQVAIGMAAYTGRLSLDELLTLNRALDFQAKSGSGFQPEFRD
jgi:phosphoribosylformimino-5-aminoimidazole carboxamide ribotide isomerase